MTWEEIVREVGTFVMVMLLMLVVLNQKRRIEELERKVRSIGL